MPKKLDPKVAEKVMLKAGLKPSEPYINNVTKWKCKCLKCGATVYPRQKEIQRGNGGCKNCGIEKQANSKKLSSKKVVAVMLKAGLKPLEPYKSSRSSWKCKCLVCKKTLTTSYHSVAYHKTGCRYCNNKKKEVNNKSKDAYKIAKKAGLKPLVPYVSVHTAWKCKCLICNRIVSPALNQLRKGQGCKYCAKYGFNLNVASYIYLITHEEFQSHKVGIGNKKNNYTDRLRKFNKQGWRTYKVWNFKNGAKVVKLEKSIFNVIRNDMELPIHPSIEQTGKRLGGWSETINADSITLLELENIINKVIKGYRENP